MAFEQRLGQRLVQAEPDFAVGQFDISMVQGSVG